MKISTAAMVILSALASAAFAAEPAPLIDLMEGKIGGVFIGAPRKELAKRFAEGGEWTGSWLIHKDTGLFVQPAAVRNMAGASLRANSWPARKYGISVFAGKISFGLDGASTLEAAVEALRKGFDGSFFVTLEEERGVWNRQFIAYQLTGWKMNPPFYFEIYFGKDKMLEEIRIKSFPNKYYPAMLTQRATGPDAVEAQLAR